MALILSIETSAVSCSAALHREGHEIGAVQVAEPQAHASQLALLIERLFSEAGLSIKTLEAVAISSGPGSYTGLRIGTSTAKGICFALDVPLIAVNTPDLLAFQARKRITDDGFFCPMIDARRMEVYCEVFDSDFRTVWPLDARIVERHSFNELLDRSRVFFFGDGAEKCRAVLNHPNAIFVDGITPEASALGEMASLKFENKEFEDLVEFTPLYVKEFVAKKARPFF